jgi:hypothetical protein
MSVLADLALAPQVEAVARKIAGHNRVRACRRSLMAFEFDARNSQPFEDMNLQSSYPTEARSVAHALCRDPMFEGAQTIAAPKPLEWDDRLATILEDKARDLAGRSIGMSGERSKGASLISASSTLREWSPPLGRARGKLVS